ncbi:MAG: pyrrolo-quinoline quinone [Terriglobales bacterium]
MKQTFPALLFLAVFLVAALATLVFRYETVVNAAPAFKGVLTWHNDNERTGRNTGESTLTLKNVNVNTFGKLFVLSTDGLVDAEPLYVPNLTVNGATHNVVFVESENATVYAFDADNGNPLWQVTALGSGEMASDNRDCGQVTPKIGITSTPVIDMSSGPHGTMYVVAMSKDSNGNYYQRLHALDLTTGAEEFGGPVAIAAQYPGTGDNSQNGFVIFDPKQYNERAGLLLLNHTVYTSWGSHCDVRPYTGWLISYDESTLAQKSVLNVTPNGNEGAIWAAGAGLAADPSGNIYFDDANGTFDTTLDGNGLPINGDYGNGIIKVSTKKKKMAVTDYFNMYNTVSESNGDEDLGSGGAMVVPNVKDSGGGVHELIVGAGKDTNIYLADRTNMGKFNPNNNNQIYQELTGALAGSVFSSPAFMQGKIYYGASGDSIKAFAFNSSAKLNSTPQSKTATSFGYPGATPSISGSTKKDTILWASENTNPAVLHAYNGNNLTVELYNSNQAAGGRDHFGNGNKYITPMIANGKVYVGTQTGVGVFGLLQ